MKYLSFIFSVYVLLLSVIPGCLEDKCLFSNIETVEVGDDIPNSCDDCSDNNCCSPFLHCNTCAGFPEARVVNLIRVSIDLIYECKSEYNCSGNIPDFISSIWQPPRV